MRVLIADDHVLFRRGLGRLLEQHGIEVAGEASNGRQAVQLTRDLGPEVVIMDLSMPLMDGLEATRAILSEDPDQRILMLTIASEEGPVLDAILAGACGYQLKDASAQDLVASVRAAGMGESMISPRIAAHLVNRLRATAPDPRDDEQPTGDLTDREVEILRLVAEGKENSEIAGELFISPKTVKNHVASILDKLAIENRIQAAVFAVRAGITR
ncbi:MAG TPA: response regulator transcription factor [Solirubrobacteraceae bacterium]|nr:response regulator transcription factor [Solirubrobacteraceae bacterium]